MISFVIGAYNNPEALRTCLSSLVQQTYLDWEAYVVDNSSQKIFKLWNSWLCRMDRRIHYIYTGKDTAIEGTIHSHSLYKATEIGVAASKGEWICLPNADSYYCPWFAERMLTAAAVNDWELVYCDLVLGGPIEHHPMIVAPQLCRIDKTCFIFKREWMKPFDTNPDNYPQADGMFVVDMVARGVRHGRLAQILCTHN